MRSHWCRVANGESITQWDNFDHISLCNIAFETSWPAWTAGCSCCCYGVLLLLLGGLCEGRCFDSRGTRASLKNARAALTLEQPTFWRFLNCFVPPFLALPGWCFLQPAGCLLRLLTATAGSVQQLRISDLTLLTSCERRIIARAKSRGSSWLRSQNYMHHFSALPACHNHPGWLPRRVETSPWLHFEHTHNTNIAHTSGRVMSHQCV